MTKHTSFARNVKREAQLSSVNGDTAEFVVSSETADSYGDEVVQSGIDLDQYQRNPVVLFGHDPQQVIGKSERVWIDGQGRLRASIRFASAVPGQMGEMALAVAEMVKAGFLNAVSIGFTAGERAPIRDDRGHVIGIRFLKTTLKEISVVSVPANPDALAVARVAGLRSQSIDKLIGPAEGRTYPKRKAMERKLWLIQEEHRIQLKVLDYYGHRKERLRKQETLMDSVHRINREGEARRNRKAVYAQRKAQLSQLAAAYR